MRLAGILDDSYAIVLIGLSRKQIDTLPKKIVALERTHDQKELAEIYSASDWLFTPSYEDNYPTVNLEAEACGTPVITYDVGGCPETVRDARSEVVP